MIPPDRLINWGESLEQPPVMFVSRSGGDNPARTDVRARHQIRDSAAVQDELDSVTDRAHVPSNESQTVVSAVEMGQ